ncbi:steroid delta-isomerase [Rhodococcus fascians]|uniref:nuclear transport factor 2 family protein n=1 Tax=Nocardiaceae TaxID=85025 RepID=UPI00050C5E9A|nr:MULTISPECIES: nuclear transport factor 2 family protein [Rhodococcus]MDR6910726.1 steroid delta-isomerase [Rhodococcus sp. 3258]MDR6931907.1 steroid delta-isomerase [Rhodococcus fascians]
MTTNVESTFRATVERYLGLVESGTADEIAALYSDDATVEDPAGSIPIHGHAAIATFYEGAAALNCTTTLLTYREGGNTAAFLFRVSTTLPDSTVDVSPIDIMTFDESGKITSMKAVFSETDYQFS